MGRGRLFSAAADLAAAVEAAELERFADAAGGRRAGTGQGHGAGRSATGSAAG